MVEERANLYTLTVAHRLPTLMTSNRDIVMTRGITKEQAPHDELKKIEVGKDDRTSMITGWHRDLHAAQRGKAREVGEAETLEAEVVRMRQEPAELREENLELKGNKVKRLKPGRAGHMGRMIASAKPELIRHDSAGACQAGNDEDPALTQALYF